MPESKTPMGRDRALEADEDIENFMSGNICRCGTYIRIKEAIKTAAKSSNK
jgi:isoquinoline 1-oxidoreductase alpha subunit